MTWRKCSFLTATYAAVLFLILGHAVGQTAQTATGTTGIVVSGQAGDKTTGGFTAGNGTGTYNVSDALLAQGNASATGTGVSTPTAGTPTNAAQSSSKTVIGTTATANGTGATNVIVGVTAQQGNWAGLGDAINFANAGSTTTGNANGSQTGATPLVGNGTGTATGNSIANTTGGGTNTVVSEAKTVGSSNASSSFAPTSPTVTPTVSSGASGMGMINAQSVAGDPTKTFAQGNFSGNAAYSATNPTGASTTGSLGAEGKTNSTVSLATPGNPTVSVSASSVIQSTAQAH